MGVSRRRAQDYAERLLAHPRSEVLVTVRRGRGGVTLLHRGRALTRCHASRVGALQAAFMARALGTRVPRLGAEVTTEVPAGVLYRAVAISSLDLRREESRQLLAELLETAAMQRGLVDGSEA